MMGKLAVVGSRHADVTFVKTWLACHKHVIRQAGGGIVTGDAEGADRAAREFATLHDYALTVYKADWETHKKAAGPMRNTEIVNDCTSVVAFWDGVSRGTLDTITKAVRAGRVVRIIPLEREG